MSKRKQLRSNEKKIIASLSKSKRRSRKSRKGTAYDIEPTMNATGVSRSTVFRIRKEQREAGVLTSPKRGIRGAYKTIDGFDKNVIRKKIHEFYTIRKHLPTLRKLHEVLKTEIDYPGGRELLRQTLRRMGFRWKKTSDNRKTLIEKPSIVKQRYAFYAKKKEFEDRGLTFVFVDETWVDTAYTVNRCWQGPDIHGVTPPCNRGQRLIVVHAGTRNGFVKGAQLVYKAASSTGDYHREMNGHNFTKWLTEMILPNLTERCAIVMDNASYHSMQSDKSPTSSTRKEDIKVWLRAHGVLFTDGMLKPELLGLAKLHKPEPSYVIDQTIRSHGHEVLRLPPYHPEFNAIELIWSQVKSIVRRRNVTFRLDDTLKLTNTALQEIGDDRWRGACDHVDKLIEKMKQNDHYMSTLCERVVINIGEDTSESDYDSNTETASMGSSTDTASEIDLLFLYAQ